MQAAGDLAPVPTLEQFDGLVQFAHHFTEGVAIFAVGGSEFFDVF